jgi:phosphinothricin acetyltransferase
MKYKIEKMTSKHREAVIDVYNYYVENSYAAYTDEPVGYAYFDVFLGMSRGYPAVVVKDDTDKIVGFAFLSALHNARSFGKAACVSYFILPEHTGKGVGKTILETFERKAVEMGVESILASASSLNPGSVRFHQRHGFEECGRFRGVGVKFGRSFDMVWMQKRISTVFS